MNNYSKKLKMKVFRSVMVIFLLCIFIVSVVCVAGDDGEVEKGIEPYISFRHKDRVDKVLFTPDGSMVLSESVKDDLKISETLTGKLLQTVSFNGYCANSMALSSDGAFLVVGTNTGKVKLWDIKSMKLRKTFPVTEWSIYAVALSPDGKMLGSCAADGTVQLWDIDNTKKLKTLGKKGAYRMSSMSFSPDSKFLATLRREGRADIWDVVKGQLIATLSTKADSWGACSITFCPDANTVVIATPGLILFWKPQNNNQVQRINIPDSINPEKNINGLGPDDSRPIYIGMTIVSHDGKTAATVIKDGSIVVWDIETRAIQQKLAGLRIPDSAGGGIRAITFSSDKRLLASGNRNGTVEIYRLAEEVAVKEATVPVEGTKGETVDINGQPDDMPGVNKVFNDWFQACRDEDFELAKTILHPDAVDKAPQCIDATVKLLEMAKDKPLVIIAILQNGNIATIGAETKGGLLFQGQPILIAANLNKHEGKWRIAFITANRAEMLKEFISHTKEKSPDAKIWLANPGLDVPTVKKEKIPAAPPVKTLVDDIIQRKDRALRRKALQEIEKMLSHESTVEDKRLGLATLRKSLTARFDRKIFRPLVIAQLKSKDSHTRALALGCLPSLNAVAADLELITPMAKDSSSFVRQHVGSALISIGDGDRGDIVIPALIRLLKDSDSKVIDSTLRSMWGQYNSPEFDKLLIELSNSKQHHGRTIYHCLSTMKSKSPAVCRRLVQELDNPDWNHSGRAAWGLTYGVIEKAKPIVESGLLQALPEEMNDYTRSQEFKALGRVATEKSSLYLQSVIDSDTETEKFQEMARKILARLAENKSDIPDNLGSGKLDVMKLRKIALATKSESAGK